MMSARAHPQHCSSAGVNSGRSRVRCDTAHPGWWILLSDFEWCACWLNSNEELYECWFKLHLGERCMLTHSKHWVSILIVLIHWSDACYGSFPIHENFRRTRYSSSVMIRGRAHSQRMVSIYVNVLRFTGKCVVAHSKFYKRWSAI